MDMAATLRRSEFGQRVFDARTHAKMTQQTLARDVGMSQGTLAETEKTAMASTFTAQIAWLTGVNAYWLATGKGEMLPAPRSQAGTDQTNSTDGPAVMRMAINVLSLCLLDMDEESRQAVVDLMRGAVERPDGRWRERVGGLIEEESAPQTWEKIGTYIRVGNYHLSEPLPKPRIVAKSVSAHSKAIQDSNQPTGPGDAAGEDRDKDQSRGGDSATGLG